MECEYLFGQERGREIQQLVHEATGSPCPSWGGCTSCPLVALQADDRVLNTA